jgi:type II secretory pathway component GspD/PulD (secretin)
MKTFMIRPIIIFAALALCAPAVVQAQPQSAVEADQPVDAPAQAPPAETPAQNGGGESNMIPAETVGELIQSVMDASGAPTAEGQAEGEQKSEDGARRIRGQGTRGTAGSGTNAVSLSSLVAQQSTNHTAGATNLLRLNFRNAPLSLVLDYLSEAAGYTISPDSKVDLKGTITVWANQSVTRDEAVALLHKALTEHNYGATVEGNLLNIYVVDASNAEIVAGVPNNDYRNIPSTRELITQIVYVHNVEASQLITTLQPLMPSGTSMTANQGANAIVITDNKANIRRMVQLVKSLDTATVSASTLRVFALTYADATALAQVVSSVFQPDSVSSQGGGGRNRGGFGGFFGGFGGGGEGGRRENSGNAQTGRMSAAKVTAVADDRSNSLIVSASDEQMAMVEKLVKQMDVNIDDIVELRVFRLRYADPQETAEQLASLFPDQTTQQNSSGGRGGFRGFGMFGGPGAFAQLAAGRNSNTDSNSRKLLQTRVTAVPDPRTGSVIVSASRDLMPQISGIIEELDSDPAKKKKVYVIKVENRDPQEVVEDLQSVIATDSSGNFSTTRSSSQSSGSQLNTRQQNNLRNTGNNNNTFGTGFGTTSGQRTGR